MKQIIMVWVMLGLLSGCSKPSMSNHVKANKKQAVSFLFVQDAKQATLSPNKNKAGTYALTLIKPDHNVSYFSDRPERIDGMISLEQFTHDWNKGANSFAQDAPNAALRGGLHDKARGVAYNFELKDPKYNQKDNTFTYILTPLKGQKKITRTIHMHSVSLFVDNMARAFSISSLND